MLDNNGKGLDTKIAVMARDITYLRAAVDELKDSVLAMSNDFVTRQECTSRCKIHEAEISTLKEFYNDQKNNKRSIYAALVAAVAAVIVALIGILR